MKLLVVASTMDLGLKLGCTPSWWQLWKALHETGDEVIVTPYLGSPVEGLWWRTYPNPCRRESLLYNGYLTRRKRAGASPSGATPLTPLLDGVVRHHIRPRWREHLGRILEAEGDVDHVLFMSVPLNHIRGIPTSLEQDHGVPSSFYDGDMPTILPRYAVSRGFRINYYDGADPSEFRTFFVNSEAVAEDLRAMGARDIHPLHYAADPELFSPVPVAKAFDVAYFGYGSEFREEWMGNMIAEPSRVLGHRRFAVAGGGFRMDLGRVEHVGDLTYSQYREFCCRSRINLNITRWSHTNHYASSTSRPFELASLGSCIVSQPYRGIERWFEPGREILVAQEPSEVPGMYEWVLDGGDMAAEMGRRARSRVLREHTFAHRAGELRGVLRNLT